MNVLILIHDDSNWHPLKHKPPQRARARHGFLHPTTEILEFMFGGIPWPVGLASKFQGRACGMRRQGIIRPLQAVDPVIGDTVRTEYECDSGKDGGCVRDEEGCDGIDEARVVEGDAVT